MITVLYTISTMAVGGTPRHLLEVFAHLDRRRFTPLLYCFDAEREDQALVPAARDLGVEVLNGRIGGTLRGTAMARPVIRLALELRRRHVQVVHSYLFEANVVGTLAARLAGVPVVLVSKRSLDTYPDRGRRWACSLTNRLATRVTANAEAVRRHVHALEGCPLERIVVIPNGIDLRRVRPRPVESGGGPVVGTVGRLSPKKGQADLIEAVPAVLDRVPRARFVLIGDGPLRADLETRARALGVGDRVELRGGVPDGAAALPELDVFVLPSHMEGMSNALLEAMAAGLPTVVTDVGGNAEVVVDGETGLVVPPRDPAALAEAIVTLLKNPERGRMMGLAGRTRVAERFDVATMTTRFEALYTQLLAHRGLR